MAEINLGRVVGPQGPQGEQGAAGPQGPAGADGAKGDPGPNQVSASTKTEGFEDGQTLYSEGGFVRAKTLTASDVGALSPTGNGSNLTAEFTQATTRANLTTGEKLAVSFGKLMKWFADLKTVAFSGSYHDLSDKPDLKTVATTGSYTDLSDKPFAFTNLYAYNVVLSPDTNGIIYYKPGSGSHPYLVQALTGSDVIIALLDSDRPGELKMRVRSASGDNSPITGGAFRLYILGWR